MFDFIAGALAFFYEVWPSYGGAIILLTLAIMVVLTPLSIKSTRSMIAMSRLQPEMKKLQQKYKDDRQKLNEEMMAFYQENKINPFSSCLPLLLQMPIFIVLYRVIDGLSRVDRRNADGPKYLDQSSDLYRDLKATVQSGTEGAIEMVSWGIDLGKSLSSTMGDDGLVSAVPYILLVALVALTGYVQQKQISARNPGAAINPQQQMITRLMPGFFALISIQIPAGVVVYFVVSNLVRIAQQAVVTKLEYGDEAGPAFGLAALLPGRGPSGGNGSAGKAKGSASSSKAIDAKSQPKAPHPKSQSAKGQSAKGQSAKGQRGKSQQGRSGGSSGSSSKSGAGDAGKGPSRDGSGNGAGPRPSTAGPPAGGPRPRKKKRK